LPQGKRGGLAPFGRKGKDADGANLTDLGCPDCRGVLAVEVLANGQLSFTCRIGHAFSAESLMTAKEDELETALWTAVEIYEEVVLLEREMALRVREAGARQTAIAYERRARAALRNVTALRALIAADGPPKVPSRSG
jgi:two-component system chemotaxis response regulator CheB